MGPTNGNQTLVFNVTDDKFDEGMVAIGTYKTPAYFNDITL